MYFRRNCRTMHSAAQNTLLYVSTICESRLVGLHVPWSHSWGYVVSLTARTFLFFPSENRTHFLHQQENYTSWFAKSIASNFGNISWVGIREVVEPGETVGFARENTLSLCSFFPNLRANLFGIKGRGEKLSALLTCSSQVYQSLLHIRARGGSVFSLDFRKKREGSAASSISCIK